MNAVTSKMGFVLALLGMCLATAAIAQDLKPQSHESQSPGNRLSVRVEGMLSAMQETQYQAKTEINEQTGSFRCDCSGLIGYVLREAFPEAYLSLKGTESPWRTRPYSVTYYETFVSAGDHFGWAVILVRSRRTQQHCRAAF